MKEGFLKYKVKVAASISSMLSSLSASCAALHGVNSLLGPARVIWAAPLQNPSLHTSSWMSTSSAKCSDLQACVLPSLTLIRHSPILRLSYAGVLTPAHRAAFPGAWVLASTVQQGKSSDCHSHTTCNWVPGMAVWLLLIGFVPSPCSGQKKAIWMSPSLTSEAQYMHQAASHVTHPPLMPGRCAL